MDGTELLDVHTHRHIQAKAAHTLCNAVHTAIKYRVLNFQLEAFEIKKKVLFNSFHFLFFFSPENRKEKREVKFTAVAGGGDARTCDYLIYRIISIRQ